MAQLDEFAAWWGQASYQDRINWLRSIGAGPQDFENALQDEIKRQYGYLSIYISHPEIGPILRRAGAEGWTQERMQAELHKTTWWQNTSAAAREWDLLRQTDPAEVGRKINELSAQLRDVVDQQGFGSRFTDDQLKWMSGVFLSQGLSQGEMADALFAQLEYKPGGPSLVGVAGLTMNQVKTRAQDFGLSMSDEAAFDWAKQVAQGSTTAEGIDVYLRDQAKSRYSWLGADLDRGATVRQLMDPMIQQAAQLLEISPDKIDITNPMYSPMIDHVDSSGMRRSMTNAEAATYIRERPEWQYTTNARQAAAGVGEQILRMFGKVAQ